MKTSTRRHFLRHSLAAATALGLVGCGFRLRGYSSANIPAPPTAIVGNTPIAQLLIRQLKAQNAWVENTQNAQLVLTVMHDQSTQDASAITASAQVREVELKQTFSFTIHNQQGELLAPEQTIATQRFMRYAESQAIAKEAEMALLFADMRNDVAQQVMVRLRTIAPQQPTAAK